MRKIFPLSLLCLCMAAFSALLWACHPVEPTDETRNKLHDDPYRAVFTLTPGHLHGQSFTPAGTAQRIVFELNAEGAWKLLPNYAQSWDVQRTGADGQPLQYFLQIAYYDKSGADMSYQFQTHGQEKIHQHFFIAEDVHDAHGQPLPQERRTNKIYDYLYLDTTPWDGDEGQPNVRVSGAENPCGFKGVFTFKAQRHFRLSIQLMHARVSKFYANPHQPDQLVTSPYYLPNPAQRSGDHWDLKADVQVTVH